MADRDKRMTEEMKQLYRKARVPHKFCAYCGARNEPDAQRCSQCGKDISWMRVPEPIPYDHAPPRPPGELPRQQKIFTPRALLVIGIVIALLVAFVLVLVFVTRGAGEESRSGVAPQASTAPFPAAAPRPPASPAASFPGSAAVAFSPAAR